MSVFERYEERAGQLSKERAVEVAEIQSKIAAAEAAGVSAAEEAAEAYRAVDVEAYHAAQEKKRAADDMKEMYEARLEEVKARPLIDEMEYSAGVNEIRAVQMEAEMKARAEIVKLIDRAAEIQAGVLQTLHRGDEVLACWHKVGPAAEEKPPEFAWNKDYLSGPNVEHMKAVRIYREAKGLR